MESAQIINRMAKSSSNYGFNEKTLEEARNSGIVKIIQLLIAGIEIDVSKEKDKLYERVTQKMTKDIRG